MKQIFMMLLMACANVAVAAGTVVVKSVEAHQRYPWNGLVDIVVTVQGSADDIAEAAWSFKAANCETGAALPVASIVPKGDDTGSGTTWARRFVWNAAKDVGVVKIDDLMLTVDAKILGGVQLWENGPYWAEYNVGASEPEEYGYYFWWGDTIGYKRNASNNGWISVNDGTAFSFSEDNCPTHGKDVSHLQSAGYIDSTGNLVAAHDAATAHLGAPWRTPTDAELSELINNCDTQWTTRGGVTGRLVSGRGVYASKSIFLPAAGYGNDSSRGSGGDYKSSTLHSDFTDRAWGLYFGSGYFGRYDYYRHFGESVRPLRGCANNSGFALAGNGVMTHLKLDCRTGVRECLSDGEILRYDADWYENGERVRITDNGTVVTEGSAGCYVWLPALIGSRVHELKLEVLSDDEVVAFETARFEADFVQPAKYTVVFRPNGGTGEMADQVFSFDEGQELTKCNFIREGCAFLGWSSIEGASDVEWADGAVVCNLTAAADGIVEMWAVWKVPLSVKSVKAQQRYPWNGLVDIVVTMEGFAGDVANSSCTFAATNCTTRAPVLVRNISQKGSDVGSGTTWTRRYVWDAVSDVGKEVIDDLLLVVGVEMGVQLWEDGPYWAQCNVGATRPEEYGWYFWWGGTVGYTVDEDYGWNSIDGKTTSVSFEACNCETYGKSISELLSAGYIDATGNLVAAHDAATVCLGTPWRMPKDSEIAALIGKCTVTGAMRNEKAGLIVAGKGTYASRSIFLPASGLAYGPYLYSPYTAAYFWTSTLNSDESFYAKYLTFSPGYFSQGDRILRYRGMAIRPLREIATGGTNGMITHMKLDCRTGVRECSVDGEGVRYDAGWYENAVAIQIADNGSVIGLGAVGTIAWKPDDCGSHALSLTALASDGTQVGEEAAIFAGHVEEVVHAPVSATCTESGYSAEIRCLRCNATLKEREILLPRGHDMQTIRSIVSPTCTEDGSTAEIACSRCDLLSQASEAIPALGHLPVVTKQAVKPTTVAAGCTAEIVCSRCNVVLQTSEVVKAITYVRDVQARQLWPHKKVGVEFTVTKDVQSVANENATLVLQCEIGGEIIPAEKIYGDMTLTPGRHHVIWDVEDQGVSVSTTSAKFRIGVSGAEEPDVGLYTDALYCVIDLSGGATATSYPITYLSGVPSGGWSDEYKTSKLVLRYIEPGTFMMGSPEGETGRSSDEVQHEVTLTQGFWIGVFEVTQRQYELVMGENGSYFNNASCYASRPAERVSYNEIRGNSAGYQWSHPPFNADSDSFIGRIRKKTGIPGFDLPSEAQWEYACRAGTTTPYNSGGLSRWSENSGLNKYTKSSDCSVATAKVGSFSPNGWGLYDMHGNVWEWCYDRYGTYGTTSTDPIVDSSSSYHVARGGAWNCTDVACRSARRNSSFARMREEKDTGFRLSCWSGLVR